MAYKNWKEGKAIPKSMMVYNEVWVIPKSMEDFMPPDEIVASFTKGAVVYTFDGMGYDIFNHKYIEA